MAYQKKFNKPYPGGYRDFPDESTIITASVMDNYDNTLEDFDTEFESVDGKLEKLKGVDNLKSAFKFDESGNPTGVEVTNDVVANGVSLIETKEAVSANEANITDINSSLTSVENRVTNVEKKATDNAGEIARVDGSVSELKGDLANIENDVVLVKNLVIRHVSGYYVGDRDGKVTFNSNSSYGYVVIKVDGGKTYSLSTYGSDNFSRIADINGNDLGKPNLFRDTSKSGYVFTMPAHAEYMYVCCQGWNTAPNIVALNGDDDIRKLSVSDYPYNTVIKVLIDKLFLEDKNDYLKNLLLHSYYNTVSDKNIEDIRSDKSWVAVSAGSSKVVQNSDGSYTFTRLSSTGGGMYSAIFDATSDYVKIHIKGSASSGKVDLTLAYIDSTDTWKYEKLLTVSKYNFDEIVSFDSAFYSVYRDAKKYKLQITSDNGVGVGDTVTVFCDVTEPSELQRQSEYSDTLDKMLNNICNKLSSIGNTNVAFTESKCISPNGTKYVLSVSNDGQTVPIKTIPDKTLFVGNSLLLGFANDDPLKGIWGMCATDSHNDYFYHIKNAILSKNSNAVFDRVHGAQFEMLASTDSFNTLWNTTPNTLTNQPLKNSFKSDVDLIVVQLGDNVNTDDRVLALENNIDTFIGNIKTNCPKARIIWVDGWFNADKSHDVIIKACNKWLIPNVFIKTLNTVENQQIKGAIATRDDGTTFEIPDSYITHPGNKGMELIAEEIIKVMDM